MLAWCSQQTSTSNSRNFTCFRSEHACFGNALASTAWRGTVGGCIDIVTGFGAQFRSLSGRATFRPCAWSGRPSVAALHLKRIAQLGLATWYHGFLQLCLGPKSCWCLAITKILHIISWIQLSKEKNIRTWHPHTPTNTRFSSVHCLSLIHPDSFSNAIGYPNVESLCPQSAHICLTPPSYIYIYTYKYTWYPCAAPAISMKKRLIPWGPWHHVQLLV